MKKILLILLTINVLCFSSYSFADTYVNGYYRKDGTYVDGHYRSSPNHSKSDNWSTKGNINPHTGKRGTLAD